MAYVLGLDLGTSSLKGILFDEKGQFVGSASADYTISTPKIGFSEQNPTDWVKAAKVVLHELIKQHPETTDELVGISFSGQMHSLVLLDEKDDVIRPAILWNDVRTTKQCVEIMNQAGEEVLRRTKNKALEGFTLPKILWVQENEPENWEKVRHLMLPKDYLSLWLTGKYSMDYSDAAGTLLLDVSEKVWSPFILDTFGIPQEILPTLYESSGKVGEVLVTVQEEFGFKNQVGVFAGGADNACAALGSGIIAEGVGMVSIGTSGVFLSYEPSAAVDYKGQLHVFNHAAQNQMYSMGVTLAAGNSLTWYRDTFAPNESFQDLLGEISTVSPGSDGLLFTPYIVGERTPHTDSQVRGSFIGIDTHHRLPHFSRAVLEGITFSLKDSQKMMEQETNRTFKKIVSVGGGAKNQDWLQMQADIFNAEIVSLTTEQGPGMGAAMLAALGSGLFSDESACVSAFVSYHPAVKPIEEHVETYEKVYAIYRQVYGQTKDICHQLHQI